MCESHDPVNPRRGAEYVEATQALRRSGAAGTHGKRRKDRRNTLRKAVEQSKADD